MPDTIKNHMNLLIILNLILAGISLLKDIFIAHYLGTTRVADAFTLAFFVPDTIGNNLIASAIGVASIPIFSRLSYKGFYTEYKGVMRRLTWLFMIMTGIIILVLSLYGVHLFRWLGQGLPKNVIDQSFSYFLWMIPTIMLYPLVMIASAILQTEHRFFLSGVAPVVFNVIFLIAVGMSLLMKVAAYKGGFIISSSITIAVLLQVILLWSPVIHSFKNKGSKRGIRKNARRREFIYLIAIIKNFIPYLIILLSSQSILIVERWIASTLGVGTIAGLNYAYRISQFPIWVFVAALNTVLFPSMSKWMSAKNNDTLRLYIVKVLKGVVLMTIFMSSGFYLLRVPLVSLLLQKGAFNQQSLKITTDILAGYSLSIVGQSISLVGIRFYLAKRQMFYPISILLMTMLLTMLLDVYLSRLFGAAGLGYGTAVGATINGIIFLILLQRELRPKPNLKGAI